MEEKGLKWKVMNIFCFCICFCIFCNSNIMIGLGPGVFNLHNKLYRRHMKALQGMMTRQAKFKKPRSDWTLGGDAFHLALYMLYSKKIVTKLGRQVLDCFNCNWMLLANF